MSGELPVRGTARQFEDGMIEMRLTVSFADPERPGKVGRRPTRTRDWSSVNWYGEVYSFQGKQRIVIATLWQAMEEGHRWVSQETLLAAVECEGGRVRDLFKRHPAWGTMIVPAILFGGGVNWFGLSGLSDQPS